jgi:putative ABC transport system permease protein
MEDLRHGLRVLFRKPGLALIAIVTLAAGIGLNTAIFTVVNSILLRPLPYPGADRLVQVWETWAPGNSYSGSVSPNNFLDWQDQARSFEQMGAYWVWLFTLTGTNRPTEIPGLKVTPKFFDILGVPPQLGRTFSADEDEEGKNRVAVISHDLWQTRLGGRADIVGRQIRLDDGMFTIIGVMGANFRQTETVGDEDAEVWTPLTLNKGANFRNSHYLRSVGRLKPNVSVEQAQLEITGIARRLEQSYPDSNRDRGARLVPLQQQVTGNVRQALVVLQLATGVVLLIACMNVANLLLVRGTERQKEIAIRAALGAGQWKVVRLILVENLVLGLVGGGAGLLLAWWGVDLLVSIAPSSIPRLREIQLNGSVLVFTIATSLATALMFGLAPAWQSARVNLTQVLKTGGLAGREGRLRSILIVAEIALTVVLLTGSGLLFRSLLQMQHVDLGFRQENLLTLRVSLLDSKYRQSRQIVTYYRHLLDQIQRLPGVQSAGATSSPPMILMNNMSVGFQIDGQPVEPGHLPSARYAVVTPGYFQTMGIPLVDGRGFADRDDRDATPVAIVTESFARRYFPNENPVGTKILVGGGHREIVGTVADIKHDSPADMDQESIYVPHAQTPFGTVMVMVYSASNPKNLIGPIQKIVWEADPDAAVSSVDTMNDVLSGAVAVPRFNALLLSVFSTMALVLALIGIYGVMSYNVAQRVREIGIRVALGAQPRDVLLQRIRQGVLWVLTGLLLGIAGAFGLTRLMQKLLFGVEPTDAPTFVITAALVALTALLACYVPARRAARVDAMVALREM